MSARVEAASDESRRGDEEGAVETLKYKNSNRARTAARHKVDSAKIATGVRAELSKAKVNGDGRPPQKRTTLKSSHRKQS